LELAQFWKPVQSWKLVQSLGLMQQLAAAQMFLPYLGLDRQWVGHADYLLESLWVSKACGFEQLVGEEIVAVVLKVWDA